MRRYSGPLSLALSFLLLPASAMAAEAPSELAWQDQVDLGKDWDAASHVVVSDGSVVVAGLSFFPLAPGRESRDRLTHVSAYDLSSGELRWRQAFEANGANRLFVEQGTVLLIGFVDFRVRAFDLATGEPLWESAEQVLESRVDAGALAGGVLFTAGYWRPADEPVFAQLVQARDPHSGALLWEDRGAGLPLGRRFGVSAIAAQNGLLGVVALERGARDAGVITTYDAFTGRRLWRRITDDADLRLLDADAALCRGLLFVTGTRADGRSGLPGTFVVRALAARTGKTVWQRDFTDGKRTGFSPEGLECAGPHAYAAARSNDPNDRKDAEIFLWAFGRKRGALRWRQEFEEGKASGGILQLERGLLLFRLDDRLQAYSRRKGRLVWEIDPHPEGGWTDVDLARNGHLAVAAGIVTDATKGDIVVRVLR